MKTNVSVLGTGRMGFAIAARLAEQGHAVTAWNRSAHKAAPLASKGAHVADSVHDAVRRSDVIVGVLSDYATTDALLRDADTLGALEGKLFVQLASGSPRQGRETAAWTRAHAIDFLDGAIMATPDFIGQPHCTILYAGAQARYERHRSLFEALGGNPQFVGSDPGHASALDTALLTVMWAELFGLVQGSVVSEAEGISLDDFSRHLVAIAPVLEGARADTVRRVQHRKYGADEQTMASLGAHYGAFLHLREVTHERRLPPAFVESMGKLFDAAITEGHAEDDFAVMHRYMKAQ